MSFLNISLSKRFGAGLAALILANQPVLAGPEDIMAGAFDQVTGVPVMTIMLGIIRSQESLPTTPENLDRRLQAVEAQLVQLDTRLKLVETKVDQLQLDVVRLSNISRLRELQGIRSAIDLINKELMTHPTSVTQVAILEFRAQQQADLLRDNVAFDNGSSATSTGAAICAPASDRVRHLNFMFLH